uniref:Uncharacterized protein n=1 Tax=Tanacetum cinerariifolium TaxID=118510 RepID=A0A6L2NB70_TANCI|nr:hypothetical protein [Tanacetum cinerariifolium]
MATTIEQQVALDEALVPSTQRLRIGRSNFRLPSDIQSKESTLQVVYDVLRSYPFFKAFLVTADVPEIYMQEFWATAYVHQHSIRFKLDNKKHIVNLETFRDMVHIWNFLVLPIELTNEEIKNTKAYRGYYAYAIGEAAPKPKASARRKRSGSDTSITPPTAITTPTTTGAVTPRLTTAAKGKQPAKAKSPSDPSDMVVPVQMKELVLNQGFLDVPSDDSKEEISWNSLDNEDVDVQEKNRDDDEGDEKGERDDGEEDDDDERDDDDDDDEEEIATTDEQDDTERGGDDDEETKSNKESDGDEPREEESFDPIPRTPEDSKDDGNDEEDQVLRISEEKGYTKRKRHMNYTVTSTLTREGDYKYLKTDRLRDSYQRENGEFLRTINDNMKRIIKVQVKSQVKEQVSKILPRIKQSVNAQLEAEVLTRSSHSSRTSYVVAADLSEMELKKILIEKMEGNKSIQCSDEQRNLYKALVEAYEADKIILDTYGERVILKRRRNDDDDDQGEGPSTGSDRGSKRQREGKEPESASAPLEPATRSAGRVDTLTPELLAGPTYELMKGSCNSLIELEYHLEEVYKATTDQLDWESALDVYSKRRINAVTDLKIVEWHSYKHLDWISIRRDDDKIYKFKEGDFKRLRLQDIKDILLLLIQGKLSNLTVEEHAFNVSHRMFTRSIVIQQRVEYLQLGVESYQKRLNLTQPDMIPGQSFDELPYEADILEFLRFFEHSAQIRTLTDVNINKLFQLWRSFGVVINKCLTGKSFVFDSRNIDYAFLIWEDFVYQVEHKNHKKSNEMYYPTSLHVKGSVNPKTKQEHKFSDETLNDVCNALDDRMKGIRMQYFPQTIWRKGDKGRAAAMIQAIDKMLKTRRIMRSLERFIGGRLYEGDFQTLQRTI